MSLLLETIRLENGKLHLLPLHQQRIDRSRAELFEKSAPLLLSEHINIPSFARKGLFKCRIEYGQEIKKIEFLPYLLPKIKSLRIVKNNNIDYHLKYTDRLSLLLLFEQRQYADDIIIVKNGLVTDSYFANLAFLKEGIWYTPKSPLLEGVCRSYLLSKGIIQTANIKAEDLPLYKKVRLFNSMIQWEDKLDIEMIYT